MDRIRGATHGRRAHGRARHADPAGVAGAGRRGGAATGILRHERIQARGAADMPVTGSGALVHSRDGSHTSYGRGAGTTIPSTAELLLAADWERPRSKQPGLGMSDLGGCRRRAGYQLQGYPHEKPSGSVQAVIGTAVHDTSDVALKLIRDRGRIPPDS